VFTEADNLWVAFRSTIDAVKAAYEGLQRLDAYNIGKAEEDRICLSGVGIHAGRDVWISKEDGKLFGSTVEEAFHLGEDLAENSDIVISEPTWNSLTGTYFFVLRASWSL